MLSFLKMVYFIFIGLDEYIIGCQKNQLIIWSVKYNEYNVAGLDQVTKFTKSMKF